jgi:ACR3 family arsenite transporter
MSKSPEIDEITQSSPPNAKLDIPEGNSDPEKQQQDVEESPNATKTSVYKSLGWLDRFLAVWVFLAMTVGIILGEFVPSTGPALQKETFVGVSVPIGEFCLVYHKFRAKEKKS